MNRFFNESLLPVIVLAIDPDVMHPELLSPDFLSSPEQFSCGRVYITSASTSAARLRRSPPPTADPEIDGDLGYDYSDLNATDPLYDYDDSSPVNSTLNLRSARTQTAGDAGASDPQTTFFPVLDYFAALPNVTAKENLDQRIVGGEEAFPGQLPWQVARAHESSRAGLDTLVPTHLGQQPINQFQIKTHVDLHMDMPNLRLFILSSCCLSILKDTLFSLMAFSLMGFFLLNC